MLFRSMSVIMPWGDNVSSDLPKLITIKMSFLNWIIYAVKRGNGELFGHEKFPAGGLLPCLIFILKHERKCNENFMRLDRFT